MKRFELLDIATADMAFAAYGKTKAEMFENAAKALTSVMFEGKIGKEKKKKFEIGGTDDFALLQKFLHELLFLYETEHLIFSSFKIKLVKPANHFGDYAGAGKVVCEAGGEFYDPKKHRFIIDVKAITYHKMEVRKEKGLWRCQVVVDV